MSAFKPPLDFPQSNAPMNIKRTLLAALLLAPLAVLSSAEPATSAATPAREAAATPVKEIIVVCKTHFDIGFTHRVKDLLGYYRTTMIDRALDLMNQAKDLPAEQQFVWTCPGWVMERVLEDWPGQTPQRRERLDAAVRSGRFVTHAVPFSMEAELMEPEEFARSYVFSDAVSRRYGLPLSRGAKMTDVPSQSRALATGLAHGGIKFMHIGANPLCASMQTLPPLFWWEGPDGSRVLTMYSGIYGTCASSPGQAYNAPFIGQNLRPPAGWNHKTWLALLVTIDNSGPPEGDAIKKMFSEVAEKMPGVKVRMGTMEEFADAILGEKPDLPVVKGEMPDDWIHGCMCDPGGMQTARTMRPLLPDAEVLNTELRQWNVPVGDASKDLAGAYEKSLLYVEHTWGEEKFVSTYGEGFQKLSPEALAKYEGAWEDKTDYIRAVGNIATTLLQTNLAALAQAVGGTGRRLVVYNPLPWTRSGLVEVSGQAVVAENVPPCGYKTIPDPSADHLKTSSSSDTLENRFFQVKLDAGRGTIASLVDKRTGRDWGDPAASQGLGQYLNERFSYSQTVDYCREYQQGRTKSLCPLLFKPGMPKDVPYRAASPANGSLQAFREGAKQSAVMDMPGNPANHLPATSLRVTLYDDQPYLDLELTIKDKAKDNWPEADWLCLPFKINNPQFRVGRNLGVMDPAKDILPGANRNMYAVGGGVAITEPDGAGIALCPLDHPLVSLDTPGCWKFSLDFIPKKPAVYLNLYNNQWNTNYRYWYPGTWSSRVRIWTIGKAEPIGESLFTPALEARHPLMAVVADGSDGNSGTLPAEQAGLSVSRPGVTITAYGPDFDGNKGTLLRVWEQAGTSGELTVTFPVGTKFTTATPVNLRGEKTGKPIPISSGEFKFSLHAFAPASFLLEK